MNDITIKVYSNWIQAHNLNHYKKMSNRIKKVPVVTSVSRHIGIESSLLLSKNGFQTYASRRNLEKSINTLKVADMIGKGNNNNNNTSLFKRVDNHDKKR